MSRDFWLLCALFLGLLLFSMSGAWRWLPTWLPFGRSNIQLNELRELLPGNEDVDVMAWRNKPLDMQLRKRLQSSRASVIYDKASRGGVLIEILDISAPPKAGIILTLRDESLVMYKRIGGRTTRNPRLSDEEKQSVTVLVKRVRDLVNS